MQVSHRHWISNHAAKESILP